MHDLIKGQHVRRVRLLALLASSGLVLAPTLARADDFQGLGFLPGGSNSAALGVSADGTVVVGYSFTSGDNHAFRWSGGVMTDLGALAGSSGAAAYAASANGSVVVGSAGNAAGNDRAVIWTGGSITDLGTLGGSGGAALGVSSDGSVVVGYSFTGSVNFHAFRYSSGTMNDLGTLGGTNSQAEGVSGDGTVVIGESQITASSAFHAFRYSGGSMTDLGTLGGTSSNGHAVNADGTVVVGESTIAGNVATHAFRWSGGTMSDLGTLAGGTNSYAYGVSADGNVVVGRSLSSSVPSGEAFRWSQGTGMQSLQGLLVASGVNMTGWTLSSAQSVSADGTVIVGYGRQAGRQEAWLARCSPLCNGLITVSNVTQSFAGQSAMGQTGNAAIGGMLGTMNEYATQAKQSQGARNTPFSVFGYGAYDSDPAASGTLGMTVDLARDIIIGATVGANAIKTDMVFSGSAKMSGGNAGAFIARVPDAGLQWLAGIGGTTIKGDVTRGYLNGSGLASSSGSTTANGYGTTVRVGWTFDQVWRATQVTPFASYTYSMIHFNGYTETTGPFPAVFDGFNTTAQTSRVGADARYTLAPGQWLWGTAAWAHRLDGAKSADITGTLIGLFGMTVPGASVARDWAELTAGVRWAAWKNGAVTASLTASVPEHQATTYLARIGLTQAF